MKPRVLVDPRVQEAEEAFQRMMVRFKAKTREEHIRDGIARGVLDAEGKPIPPAGAQFGVSCPVRSPAGDTA